jgi:hypothetical protein
MLAYEAMFDKAPFVIPSQQSRVNLERLEQLEIATKLGDCIAHNRECALLSCHGKDARSHEPMHAANVCERKVSPVVYVEVDIQVVWPDPQTNSRRREQVDFGCADQADASAN